MKILLIAFVIVVIAGLVPWAACALSSQCGGLTGECDLPDFPPDHRDHRSVQL